MEVSHLEIQAQVLQVSTYVKKFKLYLLVRGKLTVCTQVA